MAARRSKSLKERARRAVLDAPSNVAGLIRLFEADDFPGQTAHERLRWILRAIAAGYPGMQMGLFLLP